MIRPFTIEHNLKRLNTHVTRLKRRMHSSRIMQIMRIKNARSLREAA